MIPVRDFQGEGVYVFGLGASGLSAARALRAGGALVSVWDDAESARDKAAADDLPLESPQDLDWSRFRAAVVAPGVPLRHPAPHPVVGAASRAGVTVLGDIELFARALAATPERARPKVVGVTGTNGKSTTTALIGHIAAACGRDAQVGGNIGRPALDLEPFHTGAVYVLELSSFQLDLTESLAPDVAVWLNLSPDHLDRHGDMDAYAAAKRRIFARQGPEQTAVIGVDDARSHALAAEMAADAGGPDVTPISAGSALSRGVHAVGGVVFDALDGRVEEVADLRGARALTGRHNWQNAAAAYAACRRIGLNGRHIAAALLDFPGLPHRLEEVARAGRVRFINDSKATNTNAARQALAAFETVYWIAGGRAKGEAFTDLGPLMARVERAFFIGETAESLAAALGGRVAFEIARTLEAAVARAADAAAQSAALDPVVLLSPACASFDQFPNFAARGDAFRALATTAAARPGAATPL